MKQQRISARRRTRRSKAFYLFALETTSDVTCLTHAGLGGEEVAVQEVDRERRHPVLDLV